VYRRGVSTLLEILDSAAVREAAAKVAAVSTLLEILEVRGGRIRDCVNVVLFQPFLRF